MTKATMLLKVRRLKKLKAEQEALSNEIKRIEMDLKNELEIKGVDEMQVDVFKLRYQEVTSNRFDTGAFKKTHGELYGQYLKSSTSKRFTVA